jgi:hypothetical protein
MEVIGVGGINHKPTKKVFTSISAFLSMKVTEALVAVENANIALEKAILASCDKPMYVKPEILQNLTSGGGLTSVNFLNQGIEYLRSSLEHIDLIVNTYDIMLEEMAKKGYKGNALATSLAEYRLAARLNDKVIQPTVVTHIWHEVENRIIHDNLPKTFEFERGEFCKLREPTENLILVFEAMREAAEQDNLIDAVEENKIPMRQYFARLFSRWFYVSTMFLYSALISTELAYKEKGYGTLAEVPPVERLKVVV